MDAPSRLLSDPFLRVFRVVRKLVRIIIDGWSQGRSLSGAFTPLPFDETSSFIYLITGVPYALLLGTVHDFLSPESFELPTSIISFFMHELGVV